MYSALDDEGNEKFSYGTTLVHRDGYDADFEAVQKYGAQHYDQIVHDAGFYDGAPDPDYVAGHFKNQLAYNEWMDYQIDESAPEEFWDESQGKMVVSGEQGDNTYWDEETRSYKPIEDTPAVVSAVSPSAAWTTSAGGQQNSETTRASAPQSRPGVLMLRSACAPPD